MYEVTINTVPSKHVVVVSQQPPNVSSSVTSYSAAISNINPIVVNSNYIYSTGTNFTGLKFTTNLASGSESQFIPFPYPLDAIPVSVVCEIENGVDNLIYSYVINGVNINGFNVFFSDYLSASGYKLHSAVNI